MPSPQLPCSNQYTGMLINLLCLTLSSVLFFSCWFAQTGEAPYFPTINCLSTWHIPLHNYLQLLNDFNIALTSRGCWYDIFTPKQEQTTSLDFLRPHIRFVRFTHRSCQSHVHVYCYAGGAASWDPRDTTTLATWARVDSVHNRNAAQRSAGFPLELFTDWSHVAGIWSLHL